MTALRVGVDVGGTFTDIDIVDGESGKRTSWKVPSTPADQAEGMLHGIADALEQIGAGASDIALLAHGTTVATNTLIERRGARCALLTTQGFRDLLEIARGQRPAMYDLSADKPVPLIERAECWEVPERMLFDGTVKEPLDEDHVRTLGTKFSKQGIEAVAVCYLHSYANPVHEQRTKELLEEVAPELFVCTSHEILPEYREYERFVTTVANCFLLPPMSRYLNSLVARAQSAGISPAPLINSSSGGLLPVPTAAAKPVLTVMSGPSAGIVGAIKAGIACGCRDLITLDMGGTSTDVALINDGEAPIVTEKNVERLPLRVPTADVVSVGAGGGSIAWVDGGGFLKVGPRSAGSTPGPACYDRGGELPTVTDAMLLLGYLDPDAGLLGGRMRLAPERASAAVDTHVGERLGLSTTEAALGIVAVARANIEQAIRVVSVDRGHDPRAFALVAYGGAGPQHAATVAESLGIKRVIVPARPGTLCALGLLQTDMRTDYSRTAHFRVDRRESERLRECFAELEDQAQSWFSASDVPRQSRRLVRYADMRYVHQNHQITTPLPEDAGLDGPWEALEAAFSDLHQHAYGHRSDVPTEIIAVRLSAFGVREQTEQSGAGDAPTPAVTQLRLDSMRRRSVHLARDEGATECPVVPRDELRAGNTLTGPVIVEQMDATTLVPPGRLVWVDAAGNLVMDMEA